MQAIKADGLLVAEPDIGANPYDWALVMPFANVPPRLLAERRVLLT